MDDFGVHLEPLLDFLTGMPKDNLGHVIKDAVKWLKSASRLNLIGFVSCFVSIRTITCLHGNVLAPFSEKKRASLDETRV